jgi:uncharacterized protein (DUF1015 family)
VNVVRPFPARIVRQGSAQRVVTAMSDPLDEPGIDPVGIAVDPDAYDESAAALYVYCQRDEGGVHTGVVCDVGVQAFLDGRVRGHESVRPRRVEALIRQHATTIGPPALVALLHRVGPAFTRALEATLPTDPILDFDGPRGIRQTLWRMAEGPATSAATEELAAAQLYIADGHHRVAAALEEWQLAGKPGEAGLLCVVHPMDDLRLSAFHRRVTGPFDLMEFMALLTAAFQVRTVAQPPAPAPGSFGLYVGRSWYNLTYQGSRGHGPAGLDVAVLEARLAERLDRLTARPSYTLEIAPAQTSVDELTQRCDADGGALFTLAPPPLEVITELADVGEVMPPKTTYFAPKPCGGIFLRAEQ